MNNTDIIFPQYRKLSNNRSYYLIEASDRMVEIKVFGKYWTKSELVAKILPERNLIADLLEAHPDYYSMITKNEFDAFLASCEQNLTLARV